MRFSVLLPAYKSQFLAECIKSVLAQNYDDFELIILNDASPENVVGIVRSFSDPRIRYIENESNVGPYNLVLNWNKLLDLARGDFSICIGDDDKLLPDCLAEYASLIDKYPDLDVFHGQTEIIDDKSAVKCQLEPRPDREGLYESIWNKMKGRKQYVGDFCYRTDVLKQHGGYFFLPLAWYSDHITSFIACGNKGIANTQKTVFQYRQSSLTLSSKGNIEYKLEANRHFELCLRDLITQEPTTTDEAKYRDLINTYLDQYIRQNRINTMILHAKIDGFSSWMNWYKRRSEIPLSATDMLRVLLGVYKRKIRPIAQNA